MKTLKNLFSEELADRHDSEKQLLNFIPRLLKAATSDDLQKLLQSHLKESANHIKSIEKIFQNIGESPKTRKCEVTVGIIKECEHAIKEYHGSPESMWLSSHACRRWNTVKSPNTAACTPGLKRWKTKRWLTCCRQFWRRRKPWTTP